MTDSTRLGVTAPARQGLETHFAAPRSRQTARARPARNQKSSYARSAHAIFRRPARRRLLH